MDLIRIYLGELFLGWGYTINWITLILHELNEAGAKGERRGSEGR